MSDQNGKPVISPEEITEYFKTKFVFTDNIPEDTNQRWKIIMEARASILIDAHCTSGRFPTFIKAGRHIESAWVFVLPQPFVYKTKISVPHERDIIIEWSFSEFVVYSDSILKPDDYGQTSRWRLFVNENPMTNITNGVTFNGTLIEQKAAIKNSIIEIQKAFADTYGSLWKLCKEVTPYNTPEKACRFWGKEPFPFAPLKLNDSVMQIGLFHNQTKTVTGNLISSKEIDSNQSEAAKVQWILRTLISKTDENGIISSLHGKCYNEWSKIDYDFKNEHGEVIMKVIKLYDEEDQVKCLLPTTMWMRNNSPKYQPCWIPLPLNKQPLYNLDLLKADEESPVILTDSIELADANKLESVIFTSFICDPGQYDQVDWSPLLNRTVYYLVTNHSGIPLEFAYLNGHELAKYLKDEKSINVKFIQLKVEYNQGRDFKSIDGILAHYRDKPPTVNPESVEIFDNDDVFEKQYQKAVKFISSKPREWWEKHSNNTEELRIVKDETEKRKIIDYVLHPILIRGEATMIYAKKSTGKSAFALSLAALATSSFTLGPKRILDEKWWGIPRKLSKVLYLDFENMEGTLAERYKYFVYPQWPTDKAERAKCYENLIIEDMTKREHLDYSDSDYHENIIGLIEGAKAKGIAGQPVDLLVIDTYTKFVKNEDPQTSDNFSALLNRLRKMKIAVLIVHHSTEEGFPRGYKKMLDDLYFNIRLYRDDDEPHDLATPLKVKYVSFRSSLPATMWKEFEITCVNGEWKVDRPTKNENEEFQVIVEAYRARQYKDDSIWEMLGIKGSAFYDRVKKK